MEDLAAGPDKQCSTWPQQLENLGSESCGFVGVVGPQNAKTSGEDRRRQGNSH